LDLLSFLHSVKIRTSRRIRFFFSFSGDLHLSHSPSLGFVLSSQFDGRMPNARELHPEICPALFPHSLLRSASIRSSSLLPPPFPQPAKSLLPLSSDQPGGPEYIGSQSPPGLTVTILASVLGWGWGVWGGVFFFFFFFFFFWFFPPLRFRSLFEQGDRLEAEVKRQLRFHCNLGRTFSMVCYSRPLDDTPRSRIFHLLLCFRYFTTFHWSPFWLMNVNWLLNALDAGFGPFWNGFPVLSFLVFLCLVQIVHQRLAAASPHLLFFVYLDLGAFQNLDR